jgi:hypothetical protein
LDERRGAGTFRSLAIRDNVVEPEDVMVEEAAKVFLRFGKLMDAEEFPDQSHVGAAGELHFFRAVMETEFVGKSAGKSLRARATGVDERAIDIK